MRQLIRPDYSAGSMGNGVGAASSKWILDGAQSDPTFTSFARRVKGTELHHAMVIHDDFAVFYRGNCKS